MTRAVSRTTGELRLLVSSPRSGIWFCLLCFQPESMPRVLSARAFRFPPKCFCRPLVCLRGAYRTRCNPLADTSHFITSAWQHRKKLPLILTFLFFHVNVKILTLASSCPPRPTTPIKTKLRGRELSPGLPRDRRKY